MQTNAKEVTPHKVVSQGGITGWYHKVVSPMKNKKFEAQINQSEGEFAKELFLEFVEELPSFFRIPNKTIIFHYCYFWFARRRIDKYTARKIMRLWTKEKLCELVTYHGLRLNSNFLNQKVIK